MRRKKRMEGLAFNWPDLVGDRSLGGTEVNPLPPLSRRYNLKPSMETFEVNGATICARCGHWEANAERVAGLASGRNGCRCCAERLDMYLVADADRKAASRARVRAQQRTNSTVRPWPSRRED